MKKVQPIISRLHDRLEAAADAKTKDWWEGYLRNTVTFRGVKMDDVRRIMHDWFDAEQVGSKAVSEQKELAFDLFRHAVHSEDKLAGILMLRERLLPTLDINDVDALGSVFENEFIADWNVCDWYCVKVLGNVVMHSKSRLRTAQRIAKWTGARTLWQRRAAAVTFAAIAKRGDENFDGFADLLVGICEENVRSNERFMQTGVGWVMRELSHVEPRRVTDFVRRNVGLMSKEAFKYAVAKLPGPIKRELEVQHDGAGSRTVRVKTKKKVGERPRTAPANAKRHPARRVSG